MGTGFQFLRQVAGLLVLAGLAGGCQGRDGVIYSPPQIGNPTQPPAVRIVVPAEGARFRAHGEVRVLALATPNGTDLGPDQAVSKRFGERERWHFMQDPAHGFAVDFLAGTNRLGARTGGLVSANRQSLHGEAVPFIVTMVGYPAVEYVWPDVPAGNYALTVRVTNERGLATVSAPVNITVLP